MSGIDIPSPAAKEASLAAGAADGADDALLLVEAQRRDRHAGALRDLTDGQEVGRHVTHASAKSLTSRKVEVLR